MTRVYISLGMRVRTLNGETDEDHNGEERVTPPGTWGYISSVNGHYQGKYHYNVVFPNGAWVVLTETELLDTTQYELGEPKTLRQLCLYIQSGYYTHRFSYGDMVDEIVALSNLTTDILTLLSKTEALAHWMEQLDEQ